MRTTWKVQEHAPKHGGGVTYWIPAGWEHHVVDMLDQPHMDQVDLFTRDGNPMQVEWVDGRWVVVVDTAVFVTNNEVTVT